MFLSPSLLELQTPLPLAPQGYGCLVVGNQADVSMLLLHHRRNKAHFQAHLAIVFLDRRQIRSRGDSRPPLVKVPEWVHQ